MATPRIADQIGRVLGGRYRLVAPIGTGASAHVYLADDLKLRRRVAVKVLHPALADDESFLRRFRAEAQAVAALRHPNIMNVYDHGEDEDGPFLVLEYLGGGSVRDMLDAGHRLSPSQALLVGLEAARGLEYAHRRGLVHRDIKPANLLFDDEGRVAIADFGLARALAEAAWTEPAGAMLGTARYASPEQARGTSVDGKADVYSLALVLCEAVTGVVPFAADTTIATLMARLDKPLEVSADLGALAPVLEQAGHPDVAARMDSAALAKALDSAARDLPRPEPLPIAMPMDVDLTVTDLDLTILPKGRDLDATIIGVPASSRLFDVEADRATIDNAVDPGPKKRRRWPYALITGILIPILIAGVAWAVVQASTPSHPVLDITGKTVDQAKALLASDHLKVSERSRRYSETLPAGVIVGQSPPPAKSTAPSSLKEGRAVRVDVSKGPAPRVIPDITAKTRADVPTMLKDFKLTTEDQFNETVPKDTVISWTPNDGKPYPKGSEVHVVFSKGKEPKPVPSGIGQLYDDWFNGVKAIFTKITRKDEFSDTVPVGQITKTDPPANTLQNTDAPITVYVSKGPDMVTVPDLTGMKEEDAVSLLESKGLQAGTRYGPPRKPIFSQSPKPNASVKRGSQVDYYTG